MGRLFNAPTFILMAIWGGLAFSLTGLVFLPWLGMVPFLATLPKGLLAVAGFILAMLVVWIFTIIGCVLYALYKIAKAQYLVNRRIATR